MAVSTKPQTAWLHANDPGRERVLENYIATLRALPSDRSYTLAEPKPYTKKRSLDQNARMWAMLTDVAEQVVWYGVKLTPEEWKDVFTAALKKSKVVPGLDGGFVVIGAHTSRMSVGEMADLQTLMEAFGADPEHEVVWSEPETQDGRWPTWMPPG